MHAYLPPVKAVILTDVDSHALYPLTNDIPKSLLPIVNRPLLQYQLDLLFASGFTEAIVVTTRDAHDRLQIYIENEYHGGVDVDLICVDNHVGSAGMLRYVKDRIKTVLIRMTDSLYTTTWKILSF